MKNSKYSKEMLEEAAKHSRSVADVLRYFGVGSYSGGMSTHLRKRMILFEVEHITLRPRLFHRGLST